MTRHFVHTGDRVMKTATFKPLCVRWMIRADLPSVEYADGFTGGQEIIDLLRDKNTIGMVIEQEDESLGFMVYQLSASHIELLRLGVHAEHRRMGVGTRMIQRLAGKIVHSKRDHIACEVAERNVAAQLFLRNSGFKALPPERGAESYRMCLWRPESCCSESR
jgi:ribosomal-protein-alanine N-acetyltransferase